MLYDHVCAYAAEQIPHVGITEDLRSAFVIDAQNVANYMFSDAYASVHERWKFDDFPNCAPPFQRIWMEFRPPRYLGASDFGVRRPLIGVLINSDEANNLDNTTLELMARELNISKMELVIVMSGCRWICISHIFDMFEGSEPRYWGQMMYGVKGDGTFMYLAGKFLAQISGWAKRLAEETGVDVKMVADRMKVSMFAPMMALSFTHCKNVKVDRAPAMPEALQRARVKKGKPRSTRPHIIVIEPMRKVLSAAGHHTCSPKSMHIVRGHFKVYDEKPLFGKYQGTFWTPSHVAGSIGTPVKNQYNVNAPKGDK